MNLKEPQQIGISFKWFQFLVLRNIGSDKGSSFQIFFGNRFFRSHFQSVV